MVRQVSKGLNFSSLYKFVPEFFGGQSLCKNAFNIQKSK